MSISVDPITSDSSPESPSEALALAICTDAGMLPGAHVAIRSAVSRLLAVQPVDVHVFHPGLSQRDLDLLQLTCGVANPKARLCEHVLSLSRFAKFRSALGSTMNYAVFVLAEEIAAARIVYLDADVAVRCDLSPLWTVDMHQRPLGAVSWCDLRRANESSLFDELGYSLSEPFFNTGVLVLDATRMRDMRAADRFMDFAMRYKDRLVGCDQPVINAVLYGQIASLPRRYNTLLYANSAALGPQERSEERVWHFIGRPKPWDLWGTAFNRNSDLYLEEWRRLPNAVKSRRFSAIPQRLKRMLRYHRSYLQCLRSRPR